MQDEDADKIDELLVPMKLDYELKPVKEAGVKKESPDLERRIAFSVGRKSMTRK